MNRKDWLLVLVGAPFFGVMLALADLSLGLRGHAVTVFVVVCIVAECALGSTMARGLVLSLLRYAGAERRAAPVTPERESLGVGAG